MPGEVLRNFAPFLLSAFRTLARFLQLHSLLEAEKSVSEHSLFAYVPAIALFCRIETTTRRFSA
jgi:hypothetical protein